MINNLFCLYFGTITRLYLFVHYNYIVNITITDVVFAHAQLERFVFCFINVQVELHFPSVRSRAVYVLIG